MQTLGRVALIGALTAVAALNITLFAGIEDLAPAARGAVYGRIYLIGMVVPVISVSGVLLAMLGQRRRVRDMVAAGLTRAEAEAKHAPEGGTVEPNWWYFIGGAVFVTLAAAVGLSDIPRGQEIVFAGSLTIVLVLMRQLIAELSPAKARTLIGTAVIIFVFRAVPSPGAGSSWFSIDELGFDQQFMSVLYLITSALTLAGMFLLRPLIAKRSIAFIVVLLSIAAGILSLPNIALFYGLHHWTSAMTGGIVDARFIALMDAALESPLGQVAMIPMLAWIARNAPSNLKATFFAVMASFTNLALSAASLGTRYLNEVFVVTREVRGADGTITTAADYSQLGLLLITAAVITVAAPLLCVALVQASPLRSRD
jgi:hypothetical protein